MPNKLIVLSAPSGAGKSTLALMLLDKYKGKLKLSISYTTRLPRGKEEHGVHYFFVNELEFQAAKAADKFLETALVFGKYWYGTSKDHVESILAQGLSVLFDIDVQGAKSLKNTYKEKCVTIYIMPPSFEELETRLRARKTESEAAIRLRLNTARSEIKEAPAFDFMVVNNNLPDAFDEIEKILHLKNAL